MGSSKSIEIDLVKLKESVTVRDLQVEEKQASPEELKAQQVQLENIDIEGITEEEFLNKAAEKIGQIQKNPNKTLAKESFIKIFKYTGDYAKLKSRDVKAKAQTKRCEQFGKDHKKYLDALKATVAEEESAYEKSSMEMFDKLCITPECFERSQ
jgi:hypothetical protein